MADGLQIFSNEQFGNVRTIVEGETVLFCGSDVAGALGYERPTKAIMDHCRGVLKRDIIDNLGRTQSAGFIPEGDVYRLIVRSKLASAIQFERWLFDEVLPILRKTGAYLTPEKIEEVLLNPDTIIALATQIKTLQAKVTQDAPKVQLADAITGSKTSILVGDLAKLLSQNGIEMGQNRLFNWLRDNGYLVSRCGESRNMPTQRSMELGLMEIKETPFVSNEGIPSIARTTKITGKGQAYFINWFLENAA